MKIQSLSVVVPSNGCINKCKFCVSRMHEEPYENMLKKGNLYYDLYKKDYLNRLAFARDNGCNTVMLTGDAEPQQNWEFLRMFGDLNSTLKQPFRIVEIQTTGAGIKNDDLYFLRHHVGVSTISVSISSFDDIFNNQIVGTTERTNIYLFDLCRKIKQYRFNLRLSLNMSEYMFAHNMEDERKGPFSEKFRWLMNTCKEYQADQVTFRKLYSSGKNTSQDKWIEEHTLSDNFFSLLREQINDEGTVLERLQYGQLKVSFEGMSVVIDQDCMSKVASENAKYLILRPNCKLYTKWDDPASLIF